MESINKNIADESIEKPNEVINEIPKAEKNLNFDDAGHFTRGSNVNPLK